ncbi:MAG: tripartite tricarboxylate transporter permease [Pseudomonadota bacterium]
MIDNLLAGSSHLLVPVNLLFLLLGTALGIFFGAIPGLTATMGLALLVPFTFSMEPSTGLLMLAGIYVGAMYGDAIPAILINTPGTPAAIATTFDGYPMAQKGMAQHALVAAAFASCFGGVVALFVLASLAEPLAEMSLKFGPAEYFWLGIFGLTIISVLSTGNLLRGLMTATFGLLLSSVGMATLSGEVRLTFGFSALQGGIGLAGALIGFFCLPEILSSVIGKRSDTFGDKQSQPSLAVILHTIGDLIRRPVLLIRSSLIGLVVGIAPGAGGNIASMVSYSEAKRWERNPEELGTGTARGVAASEAANSAMAPGSLIPLLTLGIPGSPPAAVILGALMLHGMQPGNDLFAVYADITYAFIAGLALASIAVLILGTGGSFVYARVINVPSRLLAPLILIMTVVGSYAIRNNLLDVWVMLAFGVIGLALIRMRYQPAPLVLGIILGPYIEDGLVQSMMIGGASGSVLAYMTLRPISLFLIALCIVCVCVPLFTAMRNKASVTDTNCDKDGALNSDLIMGAVGLVIVAIVWSNTAGLSHHGNVFVRYVGGALLLLAVAALIKGYTWPGKSRFFASATERRRILVALCIIAAYIALLPVAGFLVASLLFYMSMAITLQNQPLSTSVLAKVGLQAVVALTGLYMLFVKLLLVPLPSGVWL